MLKLVTAVQSSERGATMVEYGILVALIAVIALAAIAALGQDVFGAFDSAQTNVVTPVGPQTPGPASP